MLGIQFRSFALSYIPRLYFIFILRPDLLNVWTGLLLLLVSASQNCEITGVIPHLVLMTFFFFNLSLVNSHGLNSWEIIG